MNEITKTSPQPTPALSRASFKPLRDCNTLGEAFASNEFKERIAAAAPSHIKPGRLLQTFIGAVSKSPLLGECSVRSYIGACLTLSQTGFEANTALGHAYLIPFRESKWNPNTRKREPVGVNINVIFGYPGLIDLSYRTGLVRNIHPDIVFPGDEFSFEYGSNAHLKHIPRQRREGDTPLFAYMHAQLKDGQAFEVMPYGDVLAIRNKSQAYRYALEAKEKAEAEGKRLPASWTEAPWVAHEYPMARKTAVRAGSKWLPRSVELYSALALEDAHDRGRHVDFGQVMEAPTIDGSPDYLSAAADAISDEPPVDPGTAHGIRGSIASPPATQTTPPPAKKPARAAKPARADEPPDEDRFGPGPDAPPPAQSQPAASRPADPPPATQSQDDADGGFEAMLVAADGAIATEEPFTEPAQFARAFMALWNDSGADGELLLEYNADALDDARADPIALDILAPLDDDEMVVDSSDASEPMPVPVVEVPQERGKLSWPGYVKTMKQALGLLNAQQFPGWAFAQRETLERCPMGQRVLVIRAMTETAGMLRASQPAWLAELVKSKPAPAAAATPPATSAPPPPSRAQSPGEPPAQTSDERWVEARIVELSQITAREQLDALVSSTAVRTIMARLRRENKALFDKADDAFSAKHHELPPAEDA